MRDILRDSLRVSLVALTPADRVAAAWPVAAGHAIAERSSVRSADQGKVVVEVNDAAWLPTLRAATPQLVADLARTSGVPVTDILFLNANGANAMQRGASTGAAADTTRSRT